MKAEYMKVKSQETDNHQSNVLIITPPCHTDNYKNFDISSLVSPLVLLCEDNLDSLEVSLTKCFHLSVAAILESNGQHSQMMSLPKRNQVSGRRKDEVQ